MPVDHRPAAISDLVSAVAGYSIDQGNADHFNPQTPARVESPAHHPGAIRPARAPQDITPRTTTRLQPDLYRHRNTVERGFNRLKNWPGTATRYDKYALTYLGGVLLAATVTHNRVRNQQTRPSHPGCCRVRRGGLLGR